MNRLAVSLALVAFAACSSQPAPPLIEPAHDRTEIRHVNCGGRIYDYQLFSPDTRKPLPAVELLHGAGGSSSDLIEIWKPLAWREKVVLIAPQIPREIQFETVAPAVFRCVADDAKKLVPVDGRRVYLFGYSMGGYLTFDAAMFQSRYFAAAAVFAAAIADEYFLIVDHAKRKIPIAIYIGDQDQFFPIAQVRKTRDFLSARGFPVRYIEFKGVDHNYGPVSDQVNRDAWTFFSAQRLPKKAK